MRHIADIVEAARKGGMARLAVAVAQEASVLEAVVFARREGIADAILVGDPEAIARAAAAANQGRGVDIAGFRIVPVIDVPAAAAQAVALVREGSADILMKGILETAVFMRAVFNKEHGISSGSLASHVAVLDVAQYHKLLVLSDAAVNIAPDLAAMKDIVRSAVRVARALGRAIPKVAMLAAIEKVNAEKMPATVTAAAIAQMNRTGEIAGCSIDGPLALDLAVSKEAAHIKGVHSEVAGDADILVAPSIEAGNMLYKGLVDLSGARAAGIVMGAAKPIVLTSRADSAETKLASVALAALVARTQ